MSSLIGIGAHAYSNPVMAGGGVDDTGWLNLNTFSSVAPGTNAWNNPAFAVISDNARTDAGTLANASDTTETLRCLDLAGATPVPVAATVVGVMMQFERIQNPSVICFDSNIQLVVSGAPAGDDKSAGVNWPNADAYLEYGGAADLWGNALTPAIVNAANFGIDIRVFAPVSGGAGPKIDHVQMKIFYTE